MAQLAIPDFIIEYSNESRNKFQAVLYGADEFVSTHVAWLVFKGSEQKAVLPAESTMDFSCLANPVHSNSISVSSGTKVHISMDSASGVPVLVSEGKILLSKKC